MKYIEYIKQQIAVIKERDPAIKTNREVFLYPSFKAMLRYRKAHKLYLEGKYYKARKISQKTARQTSLYSFRKQKMPEQIWYSFQSTTQKLL